MERERERGEREGGEEGVERVGKRERKEREGERERERERERVGCGKFSLARNTIAMNELKIRREKRERGMKMFARTMKSGPTASL